VDIEPRAFARLALDLLTNESLRNANTRFYLPASLVERQSASTTK
jgi:hypothetical protein